MIAWSGVQRILGNGIVVSFGGSHSWPPGGNDDRWKILQWWSCGSPNGLSRGSHGDRRSWTSGSRASSGDRARCGVSSGPDSLGGCPHGDRGRSKGNRTSSGSWTGGSPHGDRGRSKGNRTSSGSRTGGSNRARCSVGSRPNGLGGCPHGDRGRGKGNRTSSGSRAGGSNRARCGVSSGPDSLGGSPHGDRGRSKSDWPSSGSRASSCDRSGCGVSSRPNGLGGSPHGDSGGRLGHRATSSGHLANGQVVHSRSCDGSSGGGPHRNGDRSGSRLRCRRLRFRQLERRRRLRVKISVALPDAPGTFGQTGAEFLGRWGCQQTNWPKQPAK